MTGVRNFDFPRETSRSEAIRAVVAALDDEDLVLLDAGASGPITTVLVDGVKRVIVPSWRIGPKTTAAPRLEVIK